MTVAAAPTESANAITAPPWMVWLAVQRSARTAIRATTRSSSAAVNVTPFNSANGIFIKLIFSSGVMIRDFSMFPDAGT